MDISVVVPLYNEEESLPELFAWIERVMKAHDFSYEVIFVNDGSTDRSWQIIEQLQTKSDKVRPSQTADGLYRKARVPASVHWKVVRRTNHTVRPHCVSVPANCHTQ